MSTDGRFSGALGVCKLYLLLLLDRKTPMVVAGRGELISLKVLTVSQRSLMISLVFDLHSVIMTAQLFDRELRVLELFWVVPLSSDDLMARNLRQSAGLRLLVLVRTFCHGRPALSVSPTIQFFVDSASCLSNLREVTQCLLQVTKSYRKFAMTFHLPWRIEH
jgi:hypothetical protein